MIHPERSCTALLYISVMPWHAVEDVTDVSDKLFARNLISVVSVNDLLL